MRAARSRCRACQSPSACWRAHLLAELRPQLLERGEHGGDLVAAGVIRQPLAKCMASCFSGCRRTFEMRVHRAPGRGGTLAPAARAFLSDQDAPTGAGFVRPLAASLEVVIGGATKPVCPTKLGDRISGAGD